MMKKQILFVDDEANFLAGIKRMLHGQKDVWELHYATGVEDALNQVAQTNFDALISDVNMPKRDGFDLLETLQSSEKTRDIPVVILTGNNEVNFKSRALELGAADLLNKPVQREDLLARLQNVLRLKTYQDALKNHNDVLEKKVKERTQQLEELQLDIILRLGKAAEYRDVETGFHLIRVACYSRALAQELGMDLDFIETIFLASPLHDIGKIGIPDMVLLKPGKLSPAERAIMQQHCQIGSDILLSEPEGLKPFLRWHRNQDIYQNMKNPILNMASEITVGHHEKWDGSGYPRGLQGKDIPMPARILSLADVYDALRSVRPYKSAFTEEETVSVMKQDADTHFDPEVFSAFERIAEIFSTIHEQFSDEKAENEVLPV